MHFFYGDTRCLVLRQVAVPIEKRIEVVPPEVHAECLFVHLVLLKACAEGGHLRGPPEPLIDVGGRLQSRHLASLPASWREICAIRGSPAVLTERPYRPRHPPRPAYRCPLPRLRRVLPRLPTPRSRLRGDPGSRDPLPRLRRVLPRLPTPRSRLRGDPGSRDPPPPATPGTPPTSRTDFAGERALPPRAY